MNISLIVHDIRSCHNVGSILRTADGLGANHVYLTGYTPYPEIENDPRIPHIRQKLTAQIHKTALGAEQTVEWSYHDSVEILITQLKNEGIQLVALEQDEQSVPLQDYKPTGDVAILVGREVEGLEPALLRQADVIAEIPMYGRKESFNVAISAALALYQCRFN